MTKCRDGYYGPYKDSVVILGRSGNQSQIVEAKRSFKPSDSELIEWATGIIELLVFINTLSRSVQAQRIPLCNPEGLPWGAATRAIQDHICFLLILSSCCVLKACWTHERCTVRCI